MDRPRAGARGDVRLARPAAAARAARHPDDAARIGGRDRALRLARADGDGLLAARLRGARADGSRAPEGRRAHEGRLARRPGLRRGDRLHEPVLLPGARASAARRGGQHRVLRAARRRGARLARLARDRDGRDRRRGARDAGALGRHRRGAGRGDARLSLRARRGGRLGGLRCARWRARRGACRAWRAWRWPCCSARCLRRR